MRERPKEGEKKRGTTFNISLYRLFHIKISAPHCVNDLTSHNNNLIKLAQRGSKNAPPSLHLSLSILLHFPYHRLCGAAGISRSCAHREPASCPDTSQPMVFKRRQHCCTAGAPRPIASRVRGASVFPFCLRWVFGTVERNTAGKTGIMTAIINCVRQSCHDETNVLQETATAGFTGMSQCSAPMKHVPRRSILQLNLYKMCILSNNQTFDDMTCG